MEGLLADLPAVDGEEAAYFETCRNAFRWEASLCENNRKQALRELAAAVAYGRRLSTAAPSPCFGEWTLVWSLENRDSSDAQARVQAPPPWAMIHPVNRAIIQYAAAVRLGRRGQAAQAGEAAALGDRLIAQAPWYLHMGRRLMADAAIDDRWGEPARWLPGCETFVYREPLTRAFGPELGVFMLIVGVLGGLHWMPTARLVRAGFLVGREREYVLAARCLGAGPVRHILPNALSPIIVAATLGVGSAMLAEATLSFLGLGFPPDVPTWRRLLYEAEPFLTIDRPQPGAHPGAGDLSGGPVHQLPGRWPARRARPPTHRHCSPGAVWSGPRGLTTRHTAQLNTSG
jgi:binding-protein-dependent transport system inner membrane component